MNRYFILTSAHRSIFDEWFAAAMNDAGVAPYLSFDRRFEMTPPDNSDWERVYLMSSSQRALLRFTPDRSNGLHDARVAIWALSGKGKAHSAGVLLSAVGELAARYGVRYLDAGCHISNTDSAKILTRRFGDPWGRCPDAGWNAKLGRFEDTLHFRVKI